MSAFRIGDAGVARARRAPTPTSGLISRFSAVLASPVGILVSLPGMVALIALFLTFTGEQALRGSNLEVARERLTEQTRLVASSVRGALAQAEPVLDRLENLTRAHDPSRPYEAFAHALADLMQGRPGMAYISASFPDGTFQGAYLDRDGAIRFQDSRVMEGGTRVRRYDLVDREKLALHLEERTQYDPRQREFYSLAVTRAARVWTEPYPFYGSRATGITRAQPVYTGAERKLHAVITVDFDVNAMSSFMGAQMLPGMRPLLYASDGTILAYPAGAEEIARIKWPADRTLRYDDLEDPALASFFEAALQPSSQDIQTIVVEAGGERYQSAVTSASGDATLRWFVAYLAPESRFLRGLHAYERWSLLIAAVTLAISVIVAFLFARHITRVRREIVAARDEAQAARSEARELGSYRLTECLGKGGMGEVWRAEHRLLARQAAIKLIRPEVLGSFGDDMRARFRREAETLAALRSRNTIELFDYGVAEDDTFFFVMELLDGMDLDTLVQIHGPQPAARVVHLLQQACSSLAEAHAANFVHRDIKPANLFICRAADEVDLIKVLDFGLVRAAIDAGKPQRNPAAPAPPPTPGGSARLTFPGGMMGTPGFMPPEQALGRELDGRADLYAIGCVAVWLLSGRMVFPYDDPVQSLALLLNEPPPDLRTLVPSSVPDALLALLTACLAKQPEDRPESARALGKALRAIRFSDEEAWTEERAQAWWARNRPPKPAATVDSVPDTHESTAPTIAASQPLRT